MSKKYNLILLLASLAFASSLFGGFTSGIYTVEGTTLKDVAVNWQTGGNIITADGETTYTPQATLLRGAASMIRSAMASPGCMGVTGLPGGTSPSIADFLAKLDSMLANNLFCNEDTALNEKHASFGHEAAGFSKEGGVGPANEDGEHAFLFYGKPALPIPTLPGDAPGINIVWDKFQPQLAAPDSLAAQATMAAIIAHEVYHITKGHDGTSDAIEQDAYFAESEMICCMVSALVGQGPAAELAIDALCNRADSIAARYKAAGGQGDLPNCCVNPKDPCPEKTLPEPDPVNNPVPREDLGDNDLSGSMAGYSDTTGSWSALLDATMDSLFLHRNHPSVTGKWEYDLDNVISSTFDAQKLVGSNDRQVYIAGRNESNGNGELRSGSISVASSR